MEEIELLPIPQRRLAIFRGNPLATCCVDCGEDSEDLAKSVKVICTTVKTGPDHFQSKGVTAWGNDKVKSAPVRQEGIPDLQLEVDHDHSDSSYSEDDVTGSNQPVNALTEKTMHAYDFSSVLMHLAQLLLSIAFMESWLGGRKTQTPNVPKKAALQEDDVEPIPKIPN